MSYYVFDRLQRQVPYSAIIQPDGNQYIARIPEMGIEFSDTDGGRLVNSVTSILPAGLVIIKDGITFSQTIKLKPSVTLVGLGIRAPTLTYTGSGWAFESPDPTQVYQFLQLENFRIIGNPNALGCLRVERVRQSLFRNLRISNFGGHGVLLANDSFANRFEGVWTEGIAGSGLRTQAGPNGAPNEGLHLSCKYFGQTYGGDVSAGLQVAVLTEFHNETDTATSYGVSANDNLSLLDCHVEQTNGIAFNITANGRVIAIGGFYVGGAGLKTIAPGGSFIYIDRNSMEITGVNPFIGGHLRPSADNTYNCGDATLRWALVRAVSVVQGDIGFGPEDQPCPICGEEFKVGDNIAIKVIKLMDNKEIKARPVHLKCAQQGGRYG